MPYLLYPPDRTETTKPTYAVGYPNSVDETILQDLRRWGWKIEETTQTDPKWLNTIQKYHIRMQKPSAADGVTWPSVWDYWRKEKVRRNSLGGSTITRSRRSSLSSLTSRKKLQRLPLEEEIVQDDAPDEGAVREPSVPARQRKTITQLRKKTEQKKENSEGWNAPNPANSLGQLDPHSSGIYTYGDGVLTWAEHNERLDREITQDIMDWVGSWGILKTTQVSVRSEDGICVDERGNRAYFPPKHQLPLFDWEEEVSRTSSIKSDGVPERGPLEYVSITLSGIMKVANKWQEKDKSDQKLDSVM